MIPSSNKKVRIYITTYKNRNNDSNKALENMDRRKCQNDNDKRLFCSLCFNDNKHYNVDCGKKFAKSCSICRKNYEKRNDEPRKLYNEKTNGETHKMRDDKDLDTKNIQTSQTDLTQDLSLLKEVLTVFQSKKLEIKNSKSILMKDASVETETDSNIELKPRLTKSRVFQFSIEEDNRKTDNTFKIVNYSQPYNARTSQYSIDLIKHKSSSIPQMKLEELKYSLKEKTKSKDAIEEVNRMFATVRRSEFPDLEEENRPMIRSGPRVLPVVKTKTYQDPNKKENSVYEDSGAKKLSVATSKTYHDINKKQEMDTDKSICKCCQTNNVQMSGGDSFFKHECCYHKMLCEGKCDKCVYMLCCHYQNHSKIETGALVCESCRTNMDEKHDKCETNNCGHF